MIILRILNSARTLMTKTFWHSASRDSSPSVHAQVTNWAILGYSKSPKVIYEKIKWFDVDLWHAIYRDPSRKSFSSRAYFKDEKVSRSVGVISSKKFHVKEIWKQKVSRHFLHHWVFVLGPKKHQNSINASEYSTTKKMSNFWLRLTSSLLQRCRHKISSFCDRMTK